jgi:hypothetical protein
LFSDEPVSESIPNPVVEILAARRERFGDLPLEPAGNPDVESHHDVGGAFVEAQAVGHDPTLRRLQDTFKASFPVDIPERPYRI